MFIKCLESSNIKMTEQKIFIKNRKEQKIAILLNLADNQKGLVFVMHGLGGFKEQEHIQVFSQAFKNKAFTTVLFDTTNTLGESDGNYEDATVTNYYEDLEDVISWAENQEWYEEPFYLVGHSLGGLSSALFAEKYPEKVKGLAPISAVVSGELSMGAHSKEEIDEWKRTGGGVEESRSKPGVLKKLKWSHMEDRLKYDLLKNVDNLTMPVLLIVGEKDTVTPAEHQRILFEKLPRKKEFHVIKNAPHTFREKNQLEEIRQLFEAWIDHTV